MTTTLFQRHQSSIIDREAVAAASAPSFYDADQFYDQGGFVGATVAGNAFTIPAGLKVGWKCRFYRDDAAGPMTIALDASYSSLRPPGVTFPLSLLPSGYVELEIIATNRFAVGAYHGIAAATGDASVATRTALAALDAASRYDGQVVMVRSDNSLWRFDANSAAAADALAAVAVTAAMIVLVPTAGTGRWIRADKAFTLRLPFGIATADAAILHTVPAGFAWRPTALPYWDISTGLVGDAAWRVGVSSSNLGGDFQVKGDLLGGAGGDSIATLGAGGAIVFAGTLGDAYADADTSTNTQLALLGSLLANAGKTIRYDVIVAGAGLTNGAGMVCIPISLETGAGTMVS